MTLWAAHLKTLKGFYASDVFVVAESLEEAITAALQAYDKYCQNYLESYGYWPFIEDSWLEDELEEYRYQEDEMPDCITQHRQKVEDELKRELEPQPSAVLMIHN